MHHTHTLWSYIAKMKLICVEDTRHSLAGAIRKAQRQWEFNERQMTKRKF